MSKIITCVTGKIIEKRFCTFLTVTLFLYLIFRLLYLASNVSLHVPPDEVSHFGISELYSKSFFPPGDSKESYSLGLISHKPYLYYFLMGKLLNLNIFPLSGLVLLRLWNCVLCFITVFYGFRWFKLITDNKIAHILFLVLLTNTPMFSFTGSTVNYDNLNNLFAVLSLYYLHLFFQNHQTKEFLLCGVSLLGGCLTKVSFLPLFLVISLIFLIRECGNRKGFFFSLKRAFSCSGAKEITLFGLFICMLALNISLYGENLIQFGKVVPKAPQVLTEEQYMNHRLHAQAKITELYRQGDITLHEAVEKAKKIEHPGDRADTFYMLEKIKMNKINPTPLMDRIQYVEIWTGLMIQRSVGIAGHLTLPKGNVMLGIYKLLFFISFIFFIRFYKPAKDNPHVTDAFIVTLFYALFLMQVVNYGIYEKTLSLGKALTGRYFFPVLIPFYGLTAYYLVNQLKKCLQVGIAIIISCYFIYGDFPYFLSNATPDWFF